MINNESRPETADTEVKSEANQISENITVEQLKESGPNFKLIHRLGNSEIDLLCLRIDPEDKLIAGGYANGKIKVFDISNGSLVNEFINSEYELPVTSLRWRPQNSSKKSRNILVAGSSEGNVTYWHVNSGKLLNKFLEPENQVLAMDYNVDGSKLATAGKDFTVRIYDEFTKACTNTLCSSYWRSAGHSNRIFSVKFIQEEPNVIISGGWDANVFFWDIREGKSIGSIYGPSISGDSLDCQNGVILTGSHKNKEQIQTWDLGTRKIIQNINWDLGVQNQGVYVYSAQFAKRSGNYIFTGSSGVNEARAFTNSNPSQPISSIKGMQKGCYTLDSGNQSNILAFGGGTGYMYITQI